jgi:hypothetical protein
MFGFLDLVSVSAVPTSARMVCRLISLRSFIILRQTNWLKRLQRVDASGKPFTRSMNITANQRP